MESSLVGAVKRFLDQNVHSSAVFLAERLVAENASEDNVGLLAEAYYRAGEGHRAIVLLQRHASTQEEPQSPQNKYLLALCCYEAGRLPDAEQALLPSNSFASSRATHFNLPNGAAGLYLMGCICRRLNRVEQAIEYFTECLKQDPFLWSAYESLCELGCETPSSVFFSPHLHHRRDAMEEPSTPLDFHHGARRPRSSSARGKKAMSRTFTEQNVDPTKRLSFSSVMDTPHTPLSPIIKTGDDVRSPLRRVLIRHKDVLHLLNSLGTAYQHLCLYQCPEALDLFHELPMQHLNSSWVQHQIARAYFEMAQYPLAAEVFQGIREREPQRLAGLSMYSTTLWHLKREVDLCYLAQQVTDFDKRSSEAWCVAGNCFSLQKEHDTALVFFQRAIQLDPTFTYAYTLAGHEYVSNEDFDKALGCFRQAIRINPRHYNAWYGMGMIYSRQEKFQLAEYHFRRALEINPQSSLLYCFMGVVLHALKKDNDAIDALHTALHLQPQNLTARYHKANILVAQNRLEEVRACIESCTHTQWKALVELREVQNYAPKEYTVHFKMGQICKRLGRPDDALRYFNNALFFNPKDANEVKAAIERLHEEGDDDAL
ncbi:Aste57867_1018 [Aphanomyces stellatus]|uniref:Aste57867_1018 protein n=1 Tax=Aphanomyces stellatus TaxID=120398 RepID=A0A485K9K9_9STRA|nr:hypothetical protein As57867_001017 [Aphanomyces stellatus]VFT78240.1 Aste57867_1018 [Aphanomyces stellatus]